MTLRHTLKSLLIITTLVFTPLTQATEPADWKITPPSQLSLISTKNERIEETFILKNISGSVTSKGKATITLDLSKLETNIPIRNERIQKYLFSAAGLAQATITAQIPATTMADAQKGKTQNTGINARLSLNGKEKALTIDVIITPASSNQVNIKTAKPILISAQDFGLSKGIRTLKDIAKLKSIKETVPVSFNLTLEK